MSARRKVKGASQPVDLGPEIEQLRAIIDELLDARAECEDLGRQLKLLQMALAAMGRLTSMVRTQGQLGGGEGLDNALEAVLQRMERELGLKLE